MGDLRYLGVNGEAIRLVEIGVLRRKDKGVK
jgi:hypothetical protein